jgi:hypothetical protein
MPKGGGASLTALVWSAKEERARLEALNEAAAAARVAELARPPSPADIRTRRTRERRCKGKLSIRCDISNNQILALAMAEFIDPIMRDDPDEVARSVCRALDRLVQPDHGPML